MAAARKVVAAHLRLGDRKLDLPLDRLTSDAKLAAATRSMPPSTRVGTVVAAETERARGGRCQVSSRWWDDSPPLTRSDSVEFAGYILGHPKELHQPSRIINLIGQSRNTCSQSPSTPPLGEPKSQQPSRGTSFRGSSRTGETSGYQAQVSTWRPCPSSSSLGTPRVKT